VSRGHSRAIDPLSGALVWRKNPSTVRCSSVTQSHGSLVFRPVTTSKCDRSLINRQITIVHSFYHSEYTCHGTWRENQTTFIIARHAGTKHGVCISFKQSTTDTAQLYIGDSCYREHQGLDTTTSDRQYTIANLTNVGRKCSAFMHNSRPTEVDLIKLSS
jgi:hypothetical protein